MIKDFVITRAPTQLPRLEEATLDGNVLGFAIALCTLTLILSACCEPGACRELRRLNRFSRGVAAIPTDRVVAVCRLCWSAPRSH